MPIYDYKCKACAHRFELLRSISNTEPVTCPKCGGAVARVYEGTWSVCKRASDGGGCGGNCSGHCAGCGGCGGH